MELSNEVKAMETHEKATAYYKASEQFGYKFLMEVKTIRDEKLFKDLGYEDFEKYVLDHFDFSKNTMNERIQSAVAWGEDYNRALGSYGKTKTHKISQLPEPERKKVIDEGIPTESGQKSIDEATTREIAEYQKRLKQKDDELKQAKRSEQLAIEQLEREQNKEPEVITQTVERVVVPDDYKDLERKSKKLEDKVFQLNRQLERIREIDNYEEKAESIKQEVEYLNGERQKLKHIFDSAEQLQQLERKFNDFFDSEMAPLKYKPLINDLTNTNGVNRMKEMVNLARAWVQDMDRMLPAENRQIIEAEMVE